MSERQFYQSKPYDNYNTPSYVWHWLEAIIEPYDVVYEPFYSKSSTSPDVLREMGKTVIWNDEDFFENYNERLEQCDICISNPPFTKYKEIIEILSKSNKPCILLLPIAKLTTKTFRNLYKNGMNTQLIIPPKRIQYIRTDENNNIEEYQPNKCSFDSCFFCFNLNLNDDIIYL